MIFLDTTYINGLILKKDTHKNFSNTIKPYLKHEAKATNITVLVEVLNSITPFNFRGEIMEVISKLLSLQVFDYLTEEDYKLALEKFKYYGGAVNFSDCTILVSMEKHGITRIVTADSDFSKVDNLRVVSGFF